MRRLSRRSESSGHLGGWHRRRWCGSRHRTWFSARRWRRCDAPSKRDEGTDGARNAGEWLRRERRRLEARTQLRTAHEMCTRMGLEAVARRAARELLATGERARKRSDETRDDLTAQEAQIARLARDGLSNPEIGTRLFISSRTVEYHLHKAFTKLGISSRNQL